MARAGGEVELHHETMGEGEPVLFLHGFPFAGALWHPVAERLADGWRCNLPDLRGMGRTPATDAAGMDDHADDLARLLDALGEARPVAVVGMSMGGYVAFALARRHPERVRALALVDTRAEPDTAEGARGRLATAERVLSEGSRVVADDMVGKLFAASAPEALRARWHAVMAATPPQGVAAALRGMAARPDSLETLRSLGRPVLVVVGAEDTVTPGESARRMAEAVPGARLETVDGAGHMAVVERPDAVAGALRRFLKELPPLKS
jgi:3-oxoadipate enol-lactonase